MPALHPSFHHTQQKKPLAYANGFSLFSDFGLLLHQQLQHLDRRLRDRSTGAEDSGSAILIQLIVILSGNYTTHNNDDILATQLLQLGDDLGNQREVACSE